MLAESEKVELVYALTFEPRLSLCHGTWHHNASVILIMLRRA